VGCGGAARALDRGWEAAAAAVDGEPRQRRDSGEVWSSGERKAVEMQARDGKIEFVGSSRTCLRSRKRHGRTGAAAGKPAARVEARAAAARCGEARRGQRGPGSGGRGAGAARGAKEGGAGAAGAREMIGEGGGITSACRAGERTGGRQRGPSCNFPKVQ
jgi:hypothetical protein